VRECNARVGRRSARTGMGCDASGCGSAGVPVRNLHRGDAVWRTDRCYSICTEGLYGRCGSVTNVPIAA